MSVVALDFDARGDFSLRGFLSRYSVVTYREGLNVVEQHDFIELVGRLWKPGFPYPATVVPIDLGEGHLRAHEAAYFVLDVDSEVKYILAVDNHTGLVRLVSYLTPGAEGWSGHSGFDCPWCAHAATFGTIDPARYLDDGGRVSQWVASGVTLNDILEKARADIEDAVRAKMLYPGFSYELSVEGNYFVVDVSGVPDGEGTIADIDHPDVPAQNVRVIDGVLVNLFTLHDVLSFSILMPYQVKRQIRFHD